PPHRPRPHGGVPGAVHGRARRVGGERRAALDPRRAGLRARRAAVGGERLHARLRRVPAARRARRRPVRAAADVPRRPRPVRGGEPGGRARRLPRAAAGRPGGAGPRRGSALPRVADDPHHVVRRGTRAVAGARRVGGHGRAGRGDRRARRRGPGGAAELALDLPGERAGRGADDDRRAGGGAREPRPGAAAARRAGGRAGHRRAGGVRVRRGAHRDRRVVVARGLGRAARRGGDAGGVRGVAAAGHRPAGAPRRVRVAVGVGRERVDAAHRVGDVQHVVPRVTAPAGRAALRGARRGPRVPAAVGRDRARLAAVVTAGAAARGAPGAGRRVRSDGRGLRLVHHARRGRLVGGRGARARRRGGARHGPRVPRARDGRHQRRARRPRGPRVRAAQHLAPGRRLDRDRGPRDGGLGPRRDPHGRGSADGRRADLGDGERVRRRGGRVGPGRPRRDAAPA
ncbi:collagen alpha-1(I) chain-like, partial [Herrania umbratica]|uniref:Collagen alpha-1(I) chain-like n=1 Tax=Herrania umbratica TaxID=108875 RepID=A0A6J1BN65_9ROSI